MLYRKSLVIILVVGAAAIGVPSLLRTLPREKCSSEGPLSVCFEPDRDVREYQGQLVAPVVSSSLDVVEVTVHHGVRDGGRCDFRSIPLENLVGTDRWVGTVPGKERGVRTYYYFAARDADGNEVTLPHGASPNWTSKRDYFELRSEGEPWRWAMWLHIFFMMGAFLLYIHALYNALVVLEGGEKVGAMVGSAVWGTVTFFIAGFPLGWTIEKQVLGNYWEGIPFGWDITDSKTLFVFLFWMIPLILHARRRTSDRGFARWVIGCAVFTVLMFLLPHSA